MATDEFAQQWSLGNHQFHLHGHPDAYYFTGESLVGQIMFSPKNDCDLKSVKLHLKGRVHFQTEGKMAPSAINAVLHPSVWFGNKKILHETIDLYEGLAVRDEPLVWPFKFTIPVDVPSSTDDDIQPAVKYNLQIDFMTSKITRISYRHPLKILTKVTKQSPLFPAIASEEEDWKELVVGTDALFKCALEKTIYDSTEKIILNYQFEGSLEKLGHVMAHLIRETKVCFASSSKTLASVALDISTVNNRSDVVVYKGEGLILPSLLYERIEPAIKISVLYRVDITCGNKAWSKKISLPVFITNNVVSSMHKSF